jgi:hypothetical protein
VGGVAYIMSQSGNGNTSQYRDPNCGHLPDCYVPGSKPISPFTLRR